VRGKPGAGARGEAGKPATRMWPSINNTYKYKEVSCH
jgi:hypothetical protein